MMILLGEFETEVRLIKGRLLEISVYNTYNQSEAFTFVIQRSKNHKFSTSFRDSGSNVSTIELRLIQI